MPTRRNFKPDSADTPTPIGSGAAANLRYIRDTIDATRTFTTVPGKGCIVMGLAGLTAAGLESIPAMSELWLPVWLATAVVSCPAALFFMERKARAQGLSLRRSVAWRFFLTLIPAFAVGAILTAALVEVVGREVIAAIWLLMYGVGLAACGTFSIPIVLIAGVAFIGLGTVTLAAPAAWAPALLAVGFGGIHIGLGAVIARDHGG